METLSLQFVDLGITRQKFESELERFQSAKTHYRNLGIFLLADAFPNLHFGFAAPTLTPVAIIFAVKINFDNYDVEPLSVQFVHPITFEPVKASQLPTNFPRKLENSPVPQPLLQADTDEAPFICIPGVREYHQHTFHTGDSWFLYRGRGREGSLCFILDNLQLYGISHISAYQIQMQLTAQNTSVNIVSDPNSFSL